ncbi:uncharacterized protein LOC132259224 [Phlebotomus argentipes]|uniref:uncharacterized protein LOC132259224 n=1 Tax=Phlebotomus argentipes TaxID=94469 RepID=UPI002892D2F5|nr:uncharacterized protein LOC132259224 [Phlebotomus argentipes]
MGTPLLAHNFPQRRCDKAQRAPQGPNHPPSARLSGGNDKIHNPPAFECVGKVIWKAEEHENLDIGTIINEINNDVFRSELQFSEFSGIDKFPSDPKLCELWIESLKLKDVTNFDTFCVCELHFKQTDYLRGTELRWKLKKDAVPSLTLHGCEDSPEEPSLIYTEELQVSPRIDTSDHLHRSSTPIPENSPTNSLISTEKFVKKSPARVQSGVESSADPSKQRIPSYLYDTGNMTIKRAMNSSSDDSDSDRAEIRYRKLKTLRKTVAEMKTKIKKLQNESSHYKKSSKRLREILSGLKNGNVVLMKKQ